MNKAIFATIRTINKDASAQADWDVEVVCSNATVDRSDEVIEQEGWQLAAFKANPVFLAAHQHKLADGRSAVIGSFQSIGLEAGAAGQQLVGKVKFADTELGREYKSLYRDGHMRAVSVGFRSLEGVAKASGSKAAKKYHHTKSELVEVSAVAVGCNPDALSRLGIDEQIHITDVGALTVELEALRLEITELKSLVVDQVDEIKSLLPDTAFSAKSHATDCSDDHESLIGSDDLPDGQNPAEKSAAAGEGLHQAVTDCLKTLGA